MSMEENKTGKTILSLQKALDIIEIMAAHEAPVRLQDIAQEAGIPSSTALRLINTLRLRGYVNQESASPRYYLSLKLFTLGSQVSANFSVLSVARPYLKEASSELGRSVNLAIEQNRQVFILEVVGGASESHVITTRPGRSVPLHCTSLGRALMFDYAQEQIDEYCAEVDLQAYTSVTVANAAALKQELERSVQRGYALDTGEYREGIMGIGVPIMDGTGRPVASISVAELCSVATQGLIDEMSAVLIRTAKQISDQI